MEFNPCSHFWAPPGPRAEQRMMHGALFGPNEPQQADKAQVQFYFNLNDVDSELVASNDFS